MGNSGETWINECGCEWSSNVKLQYQRKYFLFDTTLIAEINRQIYLIFRIPAWQLDFGTHYLHLKSLDNVEIYREKRWTLQIRWCESHSNFFSSFIGDSLLWTNPGRYRRYCSNFNKYFSLCFLDGMYYIYWSHISFSKTDWDKIGLLLLVDS